MASSSRAGHRKARSRGSRQPLEAAVSLTALVLFACGHEDGAVTEGGSFRVTAEPAAEPHAGPEPRGQVLAALWALQKPARSDGILPVLQPAPDDTHYLHIVTIKFEDCSSGE